MYEGARQISVLFSMRHLHVSAERIFIKPVSVDKNLSLLSVEPDVMMWLQEKPNWKHFFNSLHNPFELCELN